MDSARLSLTRSASAPPTHAELLEIQLERLGWTRDPRFARIAESLLELEHENTQYGREILELKERLASLRFAEQADVPQLRDICAKIVQKEKQLLHERVHSLVELEKELKLAEIGLGGALAMDRGTTDTTSDSDGLRPISPRSAEQKPGFFTDKWHKLVSMLRHSKPKTALDEAFAIEVNTTTSVQQLLNRKLKVRAAMLGVKRNPHADNEYTLHVLREKMRLIDRRIQDLQGSAAPAPSSPQLRARSMSH